MKKQDNREDNINLQTDVLIDLPLADELADETKGGSPGRAAARWGQVITGDLPNATY